MALLVNQNYETPIGTTVTSTYWRWVALAVDLSSQVVTLTLNGYVDADAFSQGKLPVSTREYRAIGVDFYTVGSALEGGEVGLSNAIYEYVKQNDQLFENATEV